MDYVKELKDKYEQLEETVQQLQETINIINSSLYSLKTNAIDNEIVVASAFNRVDDTIATLSSLNSHISKIEVSVDTLTTNLNNYVKTDDLSATMENINASINRIDSSLDYLDDSLGYLNLAIIDNEFVAAISLVNIEKQIIIIVDIMELN